ncbi:hypothetical protein DID75_03620, partial [Candidatus Marinamargulisbacteria bacterium SCGC AG-410-N11]
MSNSNLSNISNQPLGYTQHLKNKTMNQHSEDLQKATKGEIQLTGQALQKSFVSSLKTAVDYSITSPIQIPLPNNFTVKHYTRLNKSDQATLETTKKIIQSVKLPDEVLDGLLQFTQDPTSTLNNELKSQLNQYKSNLSKTLNKGFNKQTKKILNKAFSDMIKILDSDTPDPEKALCSFRDHLMTYNPNKGAKGIFYRHLINQVSQSIYLMSEAKQDIELNMDSILSDETLSQDLLSFSKSKHFSENIEFLLDCRHINTQQPLTIDSIQRLYSIFNLYIKDNAQNEVNLSAALKKPFQDIFKQLNPNQRDLLTSSNPKVIAQNSELNSFLNQHSQSLSTALAKATTEIKTLAKQNMLDQHYKKQFRIARAMSATNKAYLLQHRPLMDHKNEFDQMSIQLLKNNPQDLIQYISEANPSKDLETTILNALKFSDSENKTLQHNLWKLLAHDISQATKEDFLRQNLCSINLSALYLKEDLLMPDACYNQPNQDTASYFTTISGIIDRNLPDDLNNSADVNDKIDSAAAQILNIKFPQKTQVFLQGFHDLVHQKYPDMSKKQVNAFVFLRVINPLLIDQVATDKPINKSKLKFIKNLTRSLQSIANNVSNSADPKLLQRIADNQPKINLLTSFKPLTGANKVFMKDRLSKAILQKKIGSQSTIQKIRYNTITQSLKKINLNNQLTNDLLGWAYADVGSSKESELFTLAIQGLNKVIQTGLAQEKQLSDLLIFMLQSPPISPQAPFTNLLISKDAITSIEILQNLGFKDNIYDFYNSANSTAIKIDNTQQFLDDIYRITKITTIETPNGDIIDHFEDKIDLFATIVEVNDGNTSRSDTIRQSRDIETFLSNNRDMLNFSYIFHQGLGNSIAFLMPYLTKSTSMNFTGTDRLNYHISFKSKGNVYITTSIGYKPAKEHSDKLQVDANMTCSLSLDDLDSFVVDSLEITDIINNGLSGELIQSVYSQLSTDFIPVSFQGADAFKLLKSARTLDDYFRFNRSLFKPLLNSQLASKKSFITGIRQTLYPGVQRSMRNEVLDTMDASADPISDAPQLPTAVDQLLTVIENEKLNSSESILKLIDQLHAIETDGNIDPTFKSIASFATFEYFRNQFPKHPVTFRHFHQTIFNPASLVSLLTNQKSIETSTFNLQNQLTFITSKSEFLNKIDALVNRKVDQYTQDSQQTLSKELTTFNQGLSLDAFTNILSTIQNQSSRGLLSLLQATDKPSQQLVKPFKTYLKLFISGDLDTLKFQKPYFQLVHGQSQSLQTIDKKLAYQLLMERHDGAKPNDIVKRHYRELSKAFQKISSKSNKQIKKNDLKLFLNGYFDNYDSIVNQYNHVDSIYAALQTISDQNIHIAVPALKELDPEMVNESLFQNIYLNHSGIQGDYSIGSLKTGAKGITFESFSKAMTSFQSLFDTSSPDIFNLNFFRSTLMRNATVSFSSEIEAYQMTDKNIITVVQSSQFLQSSIKLAIQSGQLDKFIIKIMSKHNQLFSGNPQDSQSKSVNDIKQDGMAIDNLMEIILDDDNLTLECFFNLDEESQTPLFASEFLRLTFQKHNNPAIKLAMDVMSDTMSFLRINEMITAKALSKETDSSARSLLKKDLKLYDINGLQFELLLKSMNYQFFEQCLQWNSVPDPQRQSVIEEYVQQHTPKHLDPKLRSFMIQTGLKYAMTTKPYQIPSASELKVAPSSEVKQNALESFDVQDLSVLTQSSPQTNVTDSTKTGLEPSLDSTIDSSIQNFANAFYDTNDISSILDDALSPDYPLIKNMTQEDLVNAWGTQDPAKKTIEFYRRLPDLCKGLETLDRKNGGQSISAKQLLLKLHQAKNKLDSYRAIKDIYDHLVSLQNTNEDGIEPKGWAKQWICCLNYEFPNLATAISIEKDQYENRSLLF